MDKYRLRRLRILEEDREMFGLIPSEELELQKLRSLKMDRDLLAEKILFFVKEEGLKIQNKLETDERGYENGKNNNN